MKNVRKIPLSKIYDEETLVNILQKAEKESNQYKQAFDKLRENKRLKELYDLMYKI